MRFTKALVLLTLLAGLLSGQIGYPPPPLTAGDIPPLNGNIIQSGTVSAPRLPPLSGMLGQVDLSQILLTGTPNSTNFIAGTGNGSL